MTPRPKKNQDKPEEIVEAKKDSPLIDTSDRTVKSWIRLGKKRGYITYDELIALITEECFDDLDARPIRLSSQDIPTPYNGNLENLTIIQPHQIVEKVEDLISGSI